MDAALVPIIGEALQRDVVLHHALGELEGAGADRFIDELVPGLLHGFRRDHHAGAVGELRDQWRERRLQQEPHGQRIDDFDFFNLRKLRLALGVLLGQTAVEGELHGVGVEGLTILKFHVRAQLDRNGLSVRRGLVRERELRHDVKVAVDVEQLVAQRREDDAADIGARSGRIEVVRVLGKPDPQGGLRERRRCDDGGRKHGAQQNACLHDDPPDPERARAYRGRWEGNSASQLSCSATAFAMPASITSRSSVPLGLARDGMNFT